MSRESEIYDSGRAILCAEDFMTGRYFFRFRDENIVLTTLALSDSRPAPCLILSEIPGLKWSKSVPIEALREAARRGHG